MLTYSLYNCTIAVMKDPIFKYAAPYRTGGELFRVIIHQYDESNKLLWVYEVWASLEAIEDHLRLQKYPNKADLQKFAWEIYSQRLKDTNYRIPDSEGAFVTNESGIRYSDYRTFPGSMMDPDPLVQTNISIPSSLHKWLKVRAASGSKSISEVIRIALDEYRSKRT